MAKEPAAKAALAETTPLQTTTVEALTPIQHDGQAFDVGALIVMTPEQAEALIALNAAKPAAAPPAPAA
ncbi:MAG: hypothetical protein K2X74_23285 [Acetobacteraceae bacterium]|nr:hypothetical protein [Acetobacteraceae bacterium]